MVVMMMMQSPALFQRFKIVMSHPGLLGIVVCAIAVDGNGHICLQRFHLHLIAFKVATIRLQMLALHSTHPTDCDVCVLGFLVRQWFPIVRLDWQRSEVFRRSERGRTHLFFCTVCEIL